MCQSIEGSQCLCHQGDDVMCRLMHVGKQLTVNISYNLFSFRHKFVQ